MIHFGSRTLRHAFKHAPDFGVAGNWNNANRDLFRQAILDFVSNPARMKIAGTYRGSMFVTHYFDRPSRRWVAIDLADNFIAAWKSGPNQMNSLFAIGNVQ